MKLFGHDVPRTFVLLAGLESMLFLLATHFLGPLVALDPGATPLRLGMPTEFLLTGAFLTIGTALGLFNNEAVQSFSVFAGRLLLTWLLLLLAAAGLLMAAPPVEPLGQVGAYAAGLTLVILPILLARLALFWSFRLGILQKRVLVLGDGPSARAILSYLEGPGRSHYRCVRTIEDWPALGVPSPIVGQWRRTSPAAEPLSAVAEALKAAEIVVAVEDRRRRLPLAELLECKLKGIAVVDALTFWERESGRIDATQVEESWLAFGGGFHHDQSHRAIKRIVDLVVSLTFLAVVAPICAIVAVAITVESEGPLFYRQERVGLNGRVFRVWKFRSMRIDAEGDGVPRWAGAADDRVTRVGRFIRAVRIDEIPQVLNVLTGEMSFIGPRPERPYFVDQLRAQIPYYDMRHRVRPGITGWAQVNYPYGASIEDARQKLSYDLYYLKRNDLLLDLAILLQTVRVVVFPRGVH